MVVDFQGEADRKKQKTNCIVSRDPGPLETSCKRVFFLSFEKMSGKKYCESISNFPKSHGNLRGLIEAFFGGFTP